MRHLIECLRFRLQASRRRPTALRHVITPVVSAGEQLELVTGTDDHVEGDVVTFTLQSAAAERVVTVAHEPAGPSEGAAASLAATRSLHWALWRAPMDDTPFSLQTDRFGHRFPTAMVEGVAEVRAAGDRVLTTVHFTLAGARIEMCWPSGRSPADVLAYFEARVP